jgi:hypothetical protein
MRTIAIEELEDEPFDKINKEQAKDIKKIYDDEHEDRMQMLTAFNK